MIFFLSADPLIEISMMKIVILDENKLIWLILKNKKSKIKKFIICKLYVYYS